MPLYLRSDIEPDLLDFGRNPRKYPALTIKSLEVIPAPGIKSVTFKAVVQSESGGDDYLTYVQFFDVDFASREVDGEGGRTKGHTEVGRSGGNVVYWKKPSMRDNPVSLKCSCFTGDTKIMLMDGTSVPIRDLVGRKDFFVYSYDTEQKRVVAGRGYNARITGTVPIVTVTFDDGSTVRCTPDHLFLMQSGEYKQVKDILPGESLQALYRRPCPEGMTKEYEEVFQENGIWNFTHHLADLYNLLIGKYRKVPSHTRHHVDYNYLNNSPENILGMTWYEHLVLHHKRMLGDNNPMRNPISLAKMVNTHTKQGTYLRQSERMTLNPIMHNPNSVASMVKTNYEVGNYSSERMASKSLARTDESFRAIGKRQRGLIDLGVHAGLNSMIRRTQELAARGEHYTQSDLHKHRVSEHQLRLSSSGNHQFQRPDVKAVTAARSVLLMKNPEQQDMRIKGRALSAIKKNILVNGVFDETKHPRGQGIPSLGSIKSKYDLTSLIKEAMNHKVVSVVDSGTEDVYDFTVEGYSNFAIDLGSDRFSSGVFVHNCPDFRFTWEKPLYDHKGLIGRWRKYIRKTPPPPKGHPYRNPDDKLGFDKHTWSVLFALKGSGRITE